MHHFLAATSLPDNHIELYKDGDLSYSDLEYDFGKIAVEFGTQHSTAQHRTTPHRTAQHSRLFLLQQ